MTFLLFETYVTLVTENGFLLCFSSTQLATRSEYEREYC